MTYVNLANLCQYGFVSFDGTKLFSLSGPSGAGKGELVKHIRKQYGQHIHFSVSHTTRHPRTGERDGVDYHFVTQKAFEELREANAFLECKEVHGNWYGTSAEPLHEAILSGKFVFLEIDVQGIEAIRPSLPLGCFFFLDTPPGVLRKRLRARQATSNETDEQIALRLANASAERKAAARIFTPEEFVPSITLGTLEAGVAATAASLLERLESHAGQFWMPSSRGASA